MYNLKERIELTNTLYQNRTAKYLLPLLKSYGEVFVNTFGVLRIKFCGIGDFNYNTNIGDNIFCVVQVTNYKKFNNFLDFITQQDYYVEDYVFSIKNDLHCFVFKFPYPDIINLFIEGKYSEFLKKYELEQYYQKTYKSRGVEYYTSVYSILTKREEYKQLFLETLREDFGTADIVGDFEYDYPPILGMEIINYDEKEV